MKENKNFIKGSRKEGHNYKYYKRNVSGIYIIYHDTTKHYYIGNTSDVGRRLGHHFKSLERGAHSTKRFQELYNNSYYEDFSYDVLEIQSKKERDAKELELLEKLEGDPLLLNTATKNNSWISERNEDMVEGWKGKISQKAKLRTGELNPFYGKHHSEETKRKLSDVHLGKEAEYAHKNIVINGIFYKSIEEASKKLNVPIPTISHRVSSKNHLFCNWYEYTENTGVKIVDDRVLCNPSYKPSGLYEIEGELYLHTSEIMRKHSVKSSTMHYRLNSKNFPEWKRLV